MNFDEADGCYPCHFPSFILCQQLGGRDVLCRATLQETEDRGENRTAHRAEDVNVAGVATRLCWKMRHAVATDNITTKVVSFRKSQLNLRPPGHVVRSVADLEGEVPYDPPIRLLALIRVLTHATFISL